MSAIPLRYVFVISVVCCLASTARSELALESARDIPIAYETDVLVVGGSTGAVSAAVSAAKSGAGVFLAAPYPYLGDDMTATLRLWLEEGEQPSSPLTKRIFADDYENPCRRDPDALVFEYRADRPSAAIHKDTDPPSMLRDGRWADPASESVQYDSDVTITADLGKVTAVDKVRLIAFVRESNSVVGGFNVRKASLYLSHDGNQWTEGGEISANDPKCILSHQYGRAVQLVFPVGKDSRFLKLAVTKDPEYERMLLAEIEIVGEKNTAVERAAASRPMPRPMHVKRTLDSALLSASVQFLYCSYATDVLVDKEGRPCGIVMANRAGRQAVLAKTIIDATERAWVARMAGASLRPFEGGERIVKRTVIGGEPVEHEAIVSTRVIEPPFRGPFPNRQKTPSGEFPVIEYTLKVPVLEDTHAAWAAADVFARGVTFHEGQQFTSDSFFYVPSRTIVSRRTSEIEWEGVNGVPLNAFRPAGVDHFFVLGGFADVPRAHAEKLLRPVALMDLGRRVGFAAAEDAKRRRPPRTPRVKGTSADGAKRLGEVKETLTGVRPVQEAESLRQGERGLPIMGEYDVVVIGGGTAGAPAGIAAARHGAKTLVVEYLHDLGGVGTAGAISIYYHGNRVGFTASIPCGDAWIIEHKNEWWRKSLVEAGADIWFGAIGCGALVRDGRVVGAVVATPAGRGVVLAKNVIDATGNADVAAAAGAETMYTDETEFAMQGTGLPSRNLGGTYNNTDWTLADETDMLDVWRMFVHGKDKYPDAFDQGKLIDTRERRRVVGEFVLHPTDQVNGRTYHDSIVRAASDFDTHGYTIDPYFYLEHPDRKGLFCYIPYRCFLPKGLGGILVGGLGVSAHRDAVPVIRMQPDIQNGGYALGTAAAMAAAEGVELRNLDVRELQAHLVEIGNLPETVLTDEDSYPLSEEEITKGIEAFSRGEEGAALPLSHWETALPLVRRSYDAAEGEAKTRLAKMLALKGDPTGVPTLLERVRATKEWDEGWNYRAGGQYGHAESPLDQLIIALGYAKDRRAVPAILDKVALLDADSDFSHHRAAGLALELLGDSSAAEPLADLLRKPDMSGYVHSDIDRIRELDPDREVSVKAILTRRHSLRELLLARALYRCGDHEDIGKRVLESYVTDLRGHLARHAKGVLGAP